MQAVRTVGAAALRTLPVAFACILLTANPGFAGQSTPKPAPTHDQGGSSDGTTIGAHAGNTGQGYSLDPPPGKEPAGKPLASMDVNWTPPPCWMAPFADPKTFQALVLAGVGASSGQALYVQAAMGEYLAHYKAGATWAGSGEGYKDFNIDQQGKGMFWGPFENPDATGLHRFDCNATLPFFVPNGTTPKNTPNVITPEILSKLAYSHTRLPGVTIETNPAAGQTVNLPTWVWLKEKYKPVSVRAYVDLGGGQQIWAETTARPVSVHIDPGTSDAKVFPASGECAIGADGTVGAPYDGDPQADPPCGVTYLHSTQNRAPYQLNVTATWEVTWTGSGGTGGTLPNGTVDNPRTVTVREIQTVNR